MDIVSIVIEEITLEGLDGITLSALWTRLLNCRTPFPLALDTGSKQYIWENIIRVHDQLTFHLLEKPRSPLVLTDRLTATDTDANIIQEPDETPEEIYPFKLVLDGDIVGSCATYLTRKDITKTIKTDKFINLGTTLERYGECLVIVASQSIRTLVLLNNDSDKSCILGDRVYCLLERLGRARHYGETTHGKMSLRVWMGETCKFIFYMKKKLSAHGLITSQLLTIRNSKGQNVSGKLIHLKKYFVEVKPLSLLLMERLTRKLDERPNKMELLSVIREEMGVLENSFKKLYMWGSKYVKPEMRFVKDIFPEAEESFHYHKSKKKLRQVRVLRLLKMYTYSVDGMDDDVHTSMNVGDDGDDDMEDLDFGDLSFTRPLVYERPLLAQAMDATLERGEVGLSQREMGQALALSKLEARMICRGLERLGIVSKIMRDVGKQREQRFVAKAWVHQSTMHKELMEARQRILDHHLSNKEKLIDDSVTDDTAMNDSVLNESTESVEEIKTEQSTINYDMVESRMDREGSLRDSIINMESILGMEELNCHNHPRKNPHVTLRMLKRANMLLDAVKSAKVIDNLFVIQKRIIEDETKDGSTGRMDKKSLLRLIKRLEKDGQVKIFKSSKRVNGQMKEVTLLCDTSMTPDHPLVKNSIESAFNRMISFDKDTRRQLANGEKVFTLPVNAAIPNHALLKSNTKLQDLHFDGEAGRRYGYLPRMKRQQTVHEFLWYLVYGYGKEMYTPGGDNLLLDEDPLPIHRAKTDAKVSAKVYHNGATFRRFLPPLPVHSEYEKGWFLVGDVLLLLPLNIFLQVIRFNFKSSEIEEYLNEPVLKWTLVCQLPTHLRMMLMFERRYIFQFSEILLLLNRTGLLSYGNREFKEKEQIFMFLHKNASIVDTTVARTEQRPIRQFHFDRPQTVREYWFTLQWICTNTAIQNISFGKTEELMGRCQKLTRFDECYQGRSQLQVIDDGSIPGDGLGAGGLDSIFFSHRRTNWSLTAPKASNGPKRLMPVKPQGAELEYIKNIKQSINTKKSRKIEKRESTGSYEEKVGLKKCKQKKGKRKPTEIPPAEIEVVSMDTQTDMEEIGTKKNTNAAKSVKMTADGEVISTITVKGSKPARGGKGSKRKRKSTETLPAQEKVKRRRITYDNKIVFDDRDRIAMMNMTRERSEWSSREDSLLLLWRVCLVFLSGWRRDSVVPYSVVRDILHKELPESKNKTTMSCTRRLANMMKVKTTMNHINLYVGEAMQDKELVEEFRQGRNFKRIFKESDQRCKIFVDCFNRLRSKFFTGLNIPLLALPDTLEELKKKFVCNQPVGIRDQAHEEPDNLGGIYASVLHNVIHSSILLDDKTGRAHELYHLFSQYPEMIVNEVFNKMKEEHIVTKIKKGSVRDKKHKLTAIPAVGMGTYMLAQKYTYFWLTKYPRLIFMHTYEAYNQINQASRDEWAKIEAIAGYAAMVIAFMPARKLVFEVTIPEEIVTLDQTKALRKPKPKEEEEKTQSDAEEEAMIDEAEKKRAQHTNKSTSQVAATSLTAESQIIPQEGVKETSITDPGTSGINHLSKAIINQAELDTSTVSEIDSLVNSRMTSAGVIDSGTTVDDSNASVKDQKVDKSSIVSVLDNNPSSLIITKKTSISRLVVSLSHSQYIHTCGSIRYLDPQDHLVVNSCSVRTRLKTPHMPKLVPEETFDFDFELTAYIKKWNTTNYLIHPKTASHLFKCLRVLQPPSLNPELLISKLLDTSKVTQSEVELIRQIHTKVRTGDTCGLTVHEMKKEFGRILGFDKCVNILLETRIIVAVGVCELRYVSHECVRPWLIYSYKNMKGRGVTTDADEMDDLVYNLTLKDFPGAPNMPDYRSIRPSNSANGSSSVQIMLIDEQATGIMFSKKRCAPDSIEAKSPKRAHIDPDVSPPDVGDDQSAKLGKKQKVLSPEEEYVDTSNAEKISENNKVMDISDVAVPATQELTQVVSLVAHSKSRTENIGDISSNVIPVGPWNIASSLSNPEVLSKRINVSDHATKIVTPEGPNCSREVVTPSVITTQTSSEGVLVDSIDIMSPFSTPTTMHRRDIITSVCASPTPIMTRDIITSVYASNAMMVVSSPASEGVTGELDYSIMSPWENNQIMSPPNIKTHPGVASAGKSPGMKSPIPKRTAVNLVTNLERTTQPVKSPVAPQTHMSKLAANTTIASTSSSVGARKQESVLLQVPHKSYHTPDKLAKLPIMKEPAMVSASPSTDSSEKSVTRQPEPVAKNFPHDQSAQQIQLASSSLVGQKASIAGIEPIRKKQPTKKTTPEAEPEKFLVRTLTPDQRVIEQKYVNKEDISLLAAAAKKTIQKDKPKKMAPTKPTMQMRFGSLVPVSPDEASKNSNQSVESTNIDIRSQPTMMHGYSSSKRMPHSHKTPQEVTDLQNVVVTPVRSRASMKSMAVTPSASTPTASTLTPNKIQIMLPSGTKLRPEDMEKILKQVQAIVKSNSRGSRIVGNAPIVTQVFSPPSTPIAKSPRQPAAQAKMSPVGPKCNATGSVAAQGAQIGNMHSAHHSEGSSQSEPSQIDVNQGCRNDDTSELNQNTTTARTSGVEQRKKSADNDDAIPQFDGASDEKPSKGKRTRNINPKGSRADPDPDNEEIQGISSELYALCDPENSGHQRSDLPRNSSDSKTDRSKSATTEDHSKKSIPIPPAKGTYQRVRLLCRPWKTPEGTVNRPILQMMLEGLLTFIMSKPGVAKRDLESKYTPILQPVPLMELVEMLEEIGCVSRLYTHQSQKPSLFSKRIQFIPGLSVPQDENSIETILPTADCVLKMGQFIAQFKPRIKTL